jgi:hypothetical protein
MEEEALEEGDPLLGTRTAEERDQKLVNPASD